MASLAGAPLRADGRDISATGGRSAARGSHDRCDRRLATPAAGGRSPPLRGDVRQDRGANVVRDRHDDFPANLSVARISRSRMPGSASECPAPSIRWNSASRPGLVQRPGIARRARHVVAAMHDDAGNVLQPAGVADQLPVLEPAAMHEIVVLDAGEGDREILLAELAAGLGVGQQRDRLAFPQAPGARRLDLRLAVAAGQPLAVGGHHVAALGLGDRRQEALPFVREHLRHAELIVPVELRPGQRVDAAQRPAR